MWEKLRKVSQDKKHIQPRERKEMRDVHREFCLILSLRGITEKHKWVSRFICTTLLQSVFNFLNRSTCNLFNWNYIWQRLSLFQ